MTSTIVQGDTKSLRFDGDTSVRSGVVLNTERLLSESTDGNYGPWKYGECSDSSKNNDQPGCEATKKTWNGTHCNPWKTIDSPTSETLCLRTPVNVWTPSKFVVEYGVPHGWWSGMYDAKRWGRKSSDGSMMLRSSKTEGPNGKTGIQADIPVRVTTVELRGISVESIPPNSHNCTLEVRMSELDSVLSASSAVIKFCIHDDIRQTHPKDATEYDVYVPVYNLLSGEKQDVELAIHQVFSAVHSRAPHSHGMRLSIILHSSTDYDEYTIVSIDDITLGLTEPANMLNDESSSSAVTLETWVRHTSESDSVGATTKWHKFWWWTPGGEWPTAENDVLGHEYGHCEEADTYCFQRLPEGLDEQYTEIMAEDHAGNTRLVWRFDGDNSIAHAAWRAMRHGETTLIDTDLGTTRKTMDDSIPSKIINGGPHAIWGRPRFSNLLRNGDFSGGQPIRREQGSTKTGGVKCVDNTVTCGVRTIRSQSDGPPSDAIDDSLFGYSGYVLHFGNTGAPYNTASDGSYNVRSSRSLKMTSGTFRVELWMRRSSDYDGSIQPISLSLRGQDDTDITSAVIETTRARYSTTPDRWELIWKEYELKISNNKEISDFVLKLSANGNKRGHLEMTHVVVSTTASWNPTSIQGRDGSTAIFHNTPQRSFIYARPEGENTITSLLLSGGGTCDCRSSLSMGQSFCTASNTKGVDILIDSTGPDDTGVSCNVPKKINGLTLYYRDVRDQTRKGSIRISPTSGVSLRQIHDPPTEKIGVDFWVKVDGASGPAATADRKNNLVGWYDANNDDNVQVTNGNVAVWKDKSGTGRDLSQSTAMQRPWKSSGPNKWSNAIRFSPTLPDDASSTANEWKHIATLGCKEALTRGTYGTSSDAACWKGYTDDEINDVHMYGSEMKIVFGCADKELHLKYVKKDGTNTRTFATSPNVDDTNAVKWKWSADADFKGPCIHDDELTFGKWFLFKTDGPENACQTGSGQFRNTLDSTSGFVNQGGSSFFPQTGWSSKIKVYVRLIPASSSGSGSGGGASGTARTLSTGSGKNIKWGVGFTTFAVLRCDGGSDWKHQDILGTGSKGTSGHVSLTLTATGKIAAKYWTGGWKKVDNSASSTGVSSNDFKSFFESSPSKIVKRTCSNCDTHHKEIYYRRWTEVTSSLNVERLFTGSSSDWKNSDNKLGDDYDLFSTYEDALAGTNAWSHESYDGAFPGKSGRCQEREDGTDSPAWDLYVDMQSIANAEGKLQICQIPLSEERPWWVVAVRRDVNKLQLWLNGEKEADASILFAHEDGKFNS